MMSAVWQVQEAKNRLSELIEKALEEGPQTITRHGKPVVIVSSATAPRTAPPTVTDTGITKPTMSFGEFLLTMPKCDVSFERVRRSRKTRVSFE
jgi:antitoxin Phd